MPDNRLMLRFLSDGNLDLIEDTALRLLEEVGMAPVADDPLKH